ncbi:hypothetical protein [Nocardioides sp. URHA0020]|uniref:hypothetical protein n=1 Tax=Nocardioides sp. URHA0020 TaxID=1380392 RepID=UPI0012DC4659|nr:hypothetical protein [Nocardioides sp. URHA0020]
MTCAVTPTPEDSLGFDGWSPRCAGTLLDMGLFSRHASVSRDLRDRDYVLTGCPLVAHDDRVVLVDVTVRLTVRHPTDERDVPLGYDPADERAMHAVCVTVLRLMAEEVSSEDLMVGRAGVAEAVERALSFAPVGAGLDARVTSVDVRPYDEHLLAQAHEFRIVTS